MHGIAKSNTPWGALSYSLHLNRDHVERRIEIEETNNTFNLSNMCIVLALTAHIFDPGGDVVEALGAIFRVPLGRRSIVQPQMLVRATAPPMRQTLLRWKSRERRDRARFTSVIRCTMAVTLVGRVLEGVFLARCPRFGERSTGRHATGPDLSHALPHRDLFELHHLRTVQFALLHQPFEALLERRVASSGRWPRRWPGTGSRIRRRSVLTRIPPCLLVLEQLHEKVDPIPEPTSTWRARAARAGPAAGRTRALRWCLRHDSPPARSCRVSPRAVPRWCCSRESSLRASQPENSFCRTRTGSVLRFRLLLVSRSSCARGHLFSVHHTLLQPPPRTSAATAAFLFLVVSPTRPEKNVKPRHFFLAPPPPIAAPVATTRDSLTISPHRHTRIRVVR